MEENKITFDPTKHYKWEPDTEVVLKGEVFGALLNTIKAMDSTELSMMFKGIHSLNIMLHQVVAQYVDAGVFTEEVKPTEPKRKVGDPIDGGH